MFPVKGQKQKPIKAVQDSNLLELSEFIGWFDSSYLKFLFRSRSRRQGTYICFIWHHSPPAVCLSHRCSHKLWNINKALLFVTQSNGKHATTEETSRYRCKQSRAKGKCILHDVDSTGTLWITNSTFFLLSIHLKIMCCWLNTLFRRGSPLIKKWSLMCSRQGNSGQLVILAVLHLKVANIGCCNSNGTRDTTVTGHRDEPDCCLWRVVPGPGWQFQTRVGKSIPVFWREFHQSSNQEEQCSFCPGCGIVDQPHPLHRGFQGSWELAQPVHVCFVDL